MSSLRDEVNEQLEAALELLKDARERMRGNQKMAERIGLLLPPYLDVHIKDHTYQDSDNDLVRLCYLRAAALWLGGDKREARRMLDTASKSRYSGPELEFLEGIMG